MRAASIFEVLRVKKGFSQWQVGLSASLTLKFPLRLHLSFKFYPICENITSTQYFQNLLSKILQSPTYIQFSLTSNTLWSQSDKNLHKWSKPFSSLEFLNRNLKVFDQKCILPIYTKSITGMLAVDTRVPAKLRVFTCFILVILTLLPFKAFMASFTLPYF